MLNTRNLMTEDLGGEIRGSINSILRCELGTSMKSAFYARPLVCRN